MCDALVELASAYVDHEDFLSRVKSAGVNAAFLAPLNFESTGLAQIMADVRSGGSERTSGSGPWSRRRTLRRLVKAVDALRKPALPPAPEPFAEAVADLRAAEKARVDAREGRKRVIRWNSSSSSATACAPKSLKLNRSHPRSRQQTNRRRATGLQHGCAHVLAGSKAPRWSWPMTSSRATVKRPGPGKRTAQSTALVVRQANLQSRIDQSARRTNRERHPI